mmetsp:Transcript_21332/g.46798  ORF Transcript_21332/g.46798 Transcript_21332/m.46798 type:complete len:504 (-) Transcript_21332:486-1997(-)
MTEPATKKAKTEACADFGVFGMGTMGQNLALNIAERGYRLAAYNRPDEFQARIWGALDRAKKEGAAAGKTILIDAHTELPDFVAALKTPRRILLSIPSGKPVDMTLEALAPLLTEGDVVIDGGNEMFKNTERRSKEMLEKGIHFMGMGISGGEVGARHGPSLMPGGTKESWERVKDVLEAMSAKAGDVKEDAPCVTWVGPGGSGHYVKMVHNGIEYADMQFIAEAYDLMQNVCGFTNTEMAAVFDRWNKGRLQSYLFEITAEILVKKDDQEGCAGYLLDQILDQAGNKGTGKWTVQEAADVGIAVPCVSAALEARYTSAQKSDRLKCEKLYKGKVDGAELPVASTLSAAEKEGIVVEMEKALFAAKILAYAQGLSVIQAASVEYKWEVKLSELARIWRGGCIIRAKLLNTISAALKKSPHLSTLLLDEEVSAELCEAAGGLRAVVARAVAAGLSAPGFGGALAYFDGMRRGRCSANMIQAQRDFFGAHTFKRLDKEGSFHASW